MIDWDKHIPGSASGSGPSFRVEITSLHDFAVFVAIIRGELDPDGLKALTAHLTAANEGLKTAIAQDQQNRTPHT